MLIRAPTVVGASRLRVKNRHILFFSTFGIPSVYIDGVVIAYDMLFFYVEVKN